MVDPRVCAPPKGKIELADVVRRFGPQYAAEHGERMMPSHKKALADIAACCTKELGGRLYCCDDCDDTFWSYHCCRNRACPNAMRAGLKNGSRSVRPNSCPATIFTPS